jgi:signal transduction histidine kinase/CheY-like chemotaxis protein
MVETRSSDFAALVDQARDTLMTDPSAALELAKVLEGHAFGVRDGRSRAFWLQGEALARLDRPEEALLKLADARGNLTSQDSVLAGDILLAEARAAKKLDRQGHALSSYQDAYRAYDAVGGEERKKALALHGIATLYMAARRWDRALELYDRAEEVAVDGDQLRFAILTDRAKILGETGDQNAALAIAEQALRLAEDMGSPYLRANSHTLIADILINRGALDAARHHLGQARAFDDDPNASIWTSFVLQTEARLAIEEGDRPRATARLAALFDGYDMAEPDTDYRRAHQVAAEHYAALGRHEEAYSHMAAYALLDARENGAAAANSFNLSQAEFEAQNRDLEIERLRSAQLEEAAEANARERRLQTVLASVALVAAAMIVALLLVWLRSTRRARDVLEAKNAALTEAMAARQRFLASTSHEIRTPLNGVIPLAELILARDGERAEGERALCDDDRAMLQQIVRSGKLLMAIVDDILDVAKMEAGSYAVSLVRTDVAAAVADAAEMHRGKAETKGVALTCEAAACLPAYETDERLVQQAVANLVGNAVKFTDEGSVTIAVRPWAEGFEVSVRDTGIGIPADKLDRVFENFTQVEDGADRRYGGTGLGLALVKGFAELLGGKVWAESTPGVGSLFTLRIKAEAASAAAEAEPAAALPIEAGALRPVPRDGLGEVDLTRIRVLAAEDNTVNQLVLTASIGKNVALLDVVADGHAAVRAVREGTYDVVLMDNQMPGLSGADATRAIRQLPGVGAIPIIAVTADVAPAIIRELREAGMDEVVGKPLKRERLLAAMRTVLGSEERDEARLIG